MPNSPQPDPSDQLLGRVAVAAKLISMEQLAIATRQQAKEGLTKNLGDTLVQLGFLTAPALVKVLELQKSVVEKAKQKQAAAGAGGAAQGGARELGVDTDAPAARAHAQSAVGVGARGAQAGPGERRL